MAFNASQIYGNTIGDVQTNRLAAQAQIAKEEAADADRFQRTLQALMQNRDAEKTRKLQQYEIDTNAELGRERNRLTGEEISSRERTAAIPLADDKSKRLAAFASGNALAQMHSRQIKMDAPRLAELEDLTKRWKAWADNPLSKATFKSAEMAIVAGKPLNEEQQRVYDGYKKYAAEYAGWADELKQKKQLHLQAIRQLETVGVNNGWSLDLPNGKFLDLTGELKLAQTPEEEAAVTAPASVIPVVAPTAETAPAQPAIPMVAAPPHTWGIASPMPSVQAMPPAFVPGNPGMSSYQMPSVPVQPPMQWPQWIQPGATQQPAIPAMAPAWMAR